jgi:archaellum component FlaF (FlaF/FlaG flagellin family)
MKAILRLLGLAVFLCMMPSLRAADLSGTWKGSFDFQGDTMPLTFNLKASDVVVTGTVDGLPTSPADIRDGKIDGSLITFWVNTDYQGQTYKLVFKGKASDEVINFEFGTDDGSWGATVTVKRESAPSATPAALTGNWTGNFDFNGTSVPVVFKLKSSGGTVTGTVEGMGSAPIEIHDGKIDGDTVTFSVNTDYQGQTYTLNYKGKVQAGQIDFDFGTADGSWGATVTAKKG